MVRTQIYLTEQEQSALRTISDNTGRSQSELIRIAVDRLIEETQSTDRGEILGAAAGLWADGAGRADFAVAIVLVLVPTAVDPGTVPLAVHT